MERSTFEQEAIKDGFEVQESTLAARTNNPEHSHPFDARLYVVSGNITIGCDGDETTYGPGDTCQMDADKLHTESVDAEEVVFLVGRRHK